jgi:hypothetical protein
LTPRAFYFEKGERKVKIKSNGLKVILSDIDKIDFEIHCDEGYITDGRAFIHRDVVKDVKTQNTDVLLWFDRKLEKRFENLGKCIEKNVGLATVPIAATGVLIRYNGSEIAEVFVDAEGNETYLNTAYTPLLDLGDDSSETLQIPEANHRGMVVVKRGDLTVAGFMPVKLMPEDMYEARVRSARESLAKKGEPQNAAV